jgi:ribosomal protein S18 acetylase RimI-like enzyme
MKAIIEQARAEDAQKILELQKLAYQSEAAIYDDFGIPPLRQTLDEIRVEFQSQVFLKAAIDGRIVGSVRGHVRRRTCYVGRLIVHPEFQNQGIGTRLLTEIEKTFGQAERFELFTGHRSERNLYLYHKLGYRPFRSEEATDSLTIVYLEKVI